MSIIRWVSVLVAAGVAAAAVSATRDDAPEPEGEPPSWTVTLDVPERSDATPWIAASGAFVAVAWGASADGKADVFVATSTDGARTFGPPVRVNRIDGEGRLGGELPPRVAVRAAAPDDAPIVDVLWNARGAATAIKAARSRDGGRTFDAPVSLQADGAAGDRGWPALAVDAQGGAHAIWLDHRGLAAHRAASGSSGGHGSSSGAARHVHADGPAVDGAVMAQHSALYYAAFATPGDRIGSVERAIAPGVCYCCKTTLAAGADGHLVAAWRHVYPGDLRDIALAVSRDNGRTFDSPVRVNEDGWAINGCPDDGPSVAIDARGTTHIVWPTVIGTDEPEGALFYSSTTDGRRFTPRVRIPTTGGPKPTHPQLAIGSSGRLVVAWDEMVAGRRVAALREIVVAAGGEVRFGAIVTLAEGGSDNHPVLAVSNDAVIAAWASGGEASTIATRRIALP